jgi:hypothetical protein
MTVSGDMPNEKYREVTRATMVEMRQPRQLHALPEQGARAGRKRPLHLANRSNFRKAENGAFILQTFTLKLEAARLKVREILDRNPQCGYLEIVERWRQLPNGQIEFIMRRLPTAD